MNYFIKVYGWHVTDMDYNMDYEDFYLLDCPAILYERLNIRVIKKGWKNIVEFTREMLNLNYYVYLILDTAKLTVHTGDFFHDIMVYGYDDENEAFYAADCFKNGKYSFEKISYYDFSQSFAYEQSDFENIFEFHDDIILIRENPDFNPDFHPSRVKESIENYLNAVPEKYTYSRLKLEYPEEYKQYFFGKEHYKILYKHVEYGINHGGVLPHHRQVFHLMYEMKNVMCERIKFMRETEHLHNGEQYLDKYIMLRDLALSCQNLILKYQISNDTNILYNVAEKVSNIEKIELQTMRKMLDDIV